jgi:hypothetical protein
MAPHKIGGRKSYSRPRSYASGQCQNHRGLTLTAFPSDLYLATSPQPRCPSLGLLFWSGPVAARIKAPSIPERKPSPQQTSRRHGPRHSGPAQADSGEATRLMVDELRQREVGIRIAPRTVALNSMGCPRTSGSQRTLRWREINSNFRFLVTRPSNHHGRRHCFLENGSGSVGEPKVRIRLPPAGSPLRT